METVDFAEKYLETWINAMGEGKMIKAWKSFSQWTAGHMFHVLNPLAEELGYIDNQHRAIYKEYYRVDCTLYSYYEVNGFTYWSLDYAIEHENEEFSLKENKKDKEDKKGWLDEFAKLLPLKCAKSRVIIGYDSFDKDDLDKKIEACNNMLENKDVQKSMADGNILLILFPRLQYMKGLKGNEDIASLIRIYEFAINSDKTHSTKDITEFVHDKKANLIEIYGKVVGGK